ncbi:hypothetical protein BDD12DRAFT_892096 [Trichophaea hybrida]|nr:hypothetical protein BDD12DRAFT_892096 [Trichophaea hybrida]
MNSHPSSPPHTHAGNDNCASDGNYYIDVHDGSCILLELPLLKTMDEILSKAVASMHTVTETYHVQGDIDNYEGNTLVNTDSAVKHPATDPKSLLGCQRLSPMMTQTTLRGNLIRKAKYTQADPSDSSCDAEAVATTAFNLQRKPKENRSGSSNLSNMAWAVVPEYFENGMINVKGNTEQIATRSHYIYTVTVRLIAIHVNCILMLPEGLPWTPREDGNLRWIAKQIDDLIELLHECELNGKQPGAHGLEHDLKELSKQLVGFTTSQ